MNQQELDGAILSFFQLPYFTVEQAMQIKPEYLGTDTARLILADCMNQLQESGSCSITLTGTRLNDIARTFISRYITGKYETNFPEWITTLKDAYLKRELRTASEMQNGKAGIDAVYDLRVRLNELLDTVKSNRRIDLHTEFVVEMQNPKPDVFSTGFSHFDASVLDGGFEHGQNIIIGGKPGTGKTSLMLSIAKGLAERGTTCDFISYELTPKRLHRRLVSAQTGIPAGLIKRRVFSKGQLEECLAASEFIKSLSLNIVRVPGGLNQLVMHIGSSEAQIIFIDYLQRIPSSSGKSSYEQISDISNRLNETIKSTDKVLIMASSLNRAANDKPSLSDFRGSGEIEYDADIAIILSENEQTDCIDAYTPKNRDGENTIVSFKFDKPCFRFYESTTRVPEMPYYAKPGF